MFSWAKYWPLEEKNKTKSKLVAYSSIKLTFSLSFWCLSFVCVCVCDCDDGDDDDDDDDDNDNDDGEKLLLVDEVDKKKK